MPPFAESCLLLILKCCAPNLTVCTRPRTPTPHPSTSPRTPTVWLALVAQAPLALGPGNTLGSPAEEN